MDSVTALGLFKCFHENGISLSRGDGQVLDIVFGYVSLLQKEG